MNTQEATVSLWGKSTAIRIPAAIVKKSALQIGQSVRIENAIDGSITIRPVVERPDLETLLAGVTKENMPDEADVSWGKPVGSEAW
jgi:antitoxin MazE